MVANREDRREDSSDSNSFLSMSKSQKLLFSTFIIALGTEIDSGNLRLKC